MGAGSGLEEAVEFDSLLVVHNFIYAADIGSFFGRLAALVVFVLADKVPEHADLVVLVLVEVEAVLFAEPDLEQVVVKALLADAHLAGRVLEGDLAVLGGVELAPVEDLLDDVPDPALLGPAALVVVVLVLLPGAEHVLVDLLVHQLVDQGDLAGLGLDLEVGVLHELCLLDDHEVA
jgi:hypothetical protein